MKLLLYRDYDAAECESCRYPVPEAFLVTLANQGGGFSNEHALTLCPLCAQSLAGSAERYGANHYPNKDAMQQSCFCANAVLDQLGAFSEEKIREYLLEKEANK